MSLWPVNLAARGGAGSLRGAWGLLFIVPIFLAGYFVPAVIHSPFYQGLANDGLILGMLALATSFLMAQCNLVMFGVALFYGGPAYLFAIATNDLNLGPNAGGLSALAVSLIVATAIGAVVVRAKPLAFAMLTLAISQMLRQLVVVTSFRPVTGGEDGVNVNLDGAFMGLSPAALSTPSKFWFVVWTATGVIILVTWAVVRSEFGRTLRGIRDNEERMRFSGFNTYLPRLGAFVLAAAIASVAGILHTLNSAFASPELLDFSLAGNILASVLLGGSAGLIGPVAGGVAFTLGLDQFAASGHLQLFTGVTLVAVIAALPGGAEGFARSAFLRLFARRRERSDRVNDHAAS